MNRLFVAIEMSEESKRELLEAQSRMHSGIAKISWTPKKKFHMTLKFIGEVNNTQINSVIERLSQIQFEKFRLSLDKIGFFNDYRKNALRVIWVSVSPEEQVISLQKRVDEALLDIFSSEQKFQSHITLGRVVSIKKQKEFMELALKVSVRPVSFVVENFKLYNSERVGGGYRYTVLKEFQLS